MTHVTLPKRFQQISGLADYLNNDSPLSPWRNVDGWDLSTCYHDPMHVLFLGTCRDLYGSALGYWLRNGFYGEGSMNEKLRAFSCDLKEHSRAAGSLVDDLLLLFFYVFSMGWSPETQLETGFLQPPRVYKSSLAMLRMRVSFKTFTASNCGLEKTTVYPELGSVFKAAFMKAACWFFSKTAIELAEKHPAATSPKSKFDFFRIPRTQPWRKIRSWGQTIQIRFGI